MNSTHLSSDDDKDVMSLGEIDDLIKATDYVGDYTGEEPYKSAEATLYSIKFSNSLEDEPEEHKSQVQDQKQRERQREQTQLGEGGWMQVGY